MENAYFLHTFYVIGLCYLAAKYLQKIKIHYMAEKTMYSEEELVEFEELINKLDRAREELNILKSSLTRNTDEGTDSNYNSVKTLEDGADTAEKEQLSTLAGRQQKFINNLENVDQN